MKDKEIIEYSKVIVKLTKKHLEFLIEIFKISEGVEDIAKRITGNLFSVEHKTIVNFNALVTISNFELNTALIKMIETNEYWEKIFFIKLSNTIIYETLNSYKKHQLELKNISDKYNIGTFKDIGIRIKNFNKKYKTDTVTKIIRNKTAAHIEPDFNEFFNIISEIKINKSKKMIYEFSIILNMMFDFSRICYEKSDINILN